MKRPTGSPPLYLASSVTEKTLVANSERTIAFGSCNPRGVPGCAHADSGNRETAHLVSVAILELRMKLNRIDDAELKALCDAMMPDDTAEQAIAGSEIAAATGGPLLKLVK